MEEQSNVECRMQNVELGKTAKENNSTLYTQNSKLGKLIQQFCPDGVEYKTLKDVCSDIIVPMRDRPKVFDGDVPWCRIEDKEGHLFNGSLSGLGVSDVVIKQMNLKVFPIGTVICSCSASLGAYAINTKPIITNQTFIGLVCGETILNWYLLYFMETQTKHLISLASTGTIPYISRKKFEDLEIPVPPLPVQEAIVNILDRFAVYAAELQAELQARQQQYNYYRDTLLSFEGREDVQWKKLGEIEKCHCSGSTPTKTKKEYYDNGTIPWLRTQDVKFNEITGVDSFITEVAVKETSVKWIPENCVIVAISGATAGRCAINKIKTTTNQHCLNIEIDDRKALYKYVFYCVCNQYDELISLKQGARGDLNSSSILNVKIPVPSLSEQQRIVDILDRFDTLVNDLSQGLPAEIEARRQQYEYYRDQLLTFKRKEA